MFAHINNALFCLTQATLMLSIVRFLPIRTMWGYVFDFMCRITICLTFTYFHCFFCSNLHSLAHDLKIENCHHWSFKRIFSIFNQHLCFTIVLWVPSWLVYLEFRIHKHSFYLKISSDYLFKEDNYYYKRIRP